MPASFLIASHERKVEVYATLSETRDLIWSLMPPEQQPICRKLVEADARKHRVDPELPDLDTAIASAWREIAVSMAHLAKHVGGTP